jgi:hypothetical protein
VFDDAFGTPLVTSLTRSVTVNAAPEKTKLSRR